MSNFTDLFGSAGGKPKRVTRLLSGTGSFVPLVAMGRYRALLQGAGGGGGATGNPGGNGGWLLDWSGIFFTTDPLTYAVGAGSAGAAGGDTTLGYLIGPGGLPSGGAIVIVSTPVLIPGGKGSANVNSPAGLGGLNAVNQAAGVGGSTLFGLGGTSATPPLANTGAGSFQGTANAGASGQIIIIEYGV